MKYLLVGEQKLHEFTDHRNFFYVFARTEFQSNIGRNELVQNGVRQFEFTIVNVDGKYNIFDEMLTWWMKGII